MVNIGIPEHYTASPSSISGTPYLTINRDVTIDLDSTNAFEGKPAEVEAPHISLTSKRAREASRSMVQLLFGLLARGHRAGRAQSCPLADMEGYAGAGQLQGPLSR